MSNEERIQPGKYVELGYDLYTVDGQGAEILVHQTDVEDPEIIVYGATREVIEPLEQAILGLKVGDSFDVRATSEQAHGPRDPEQIVPLEKDIFLIDGKFDSTRIYPGAVVPMMTAEGYRIQGIVAEVTDQTVKMDFNHPLAGKDLRFKGKILAVRDATEADLRLLQGGCSCQGGCGEDGGCDQGGCQSGGCGGCAC